jgi:hypothetical protein
MNTFYFNTGVIPHNVSNFPYEYHKKIGNIIRNTLLIPFECEAPENSTLLYLCNNDKLPESNYENIGVFPVFNTNMCSKFAYFRLNTN